MTAHYDLIVIGGGLAGASFSRVMALQGSAVLMLEREPRFRERLRGEALHPWGIAEAKKLGLYESLRDRCGHHPTLWQVYQQGAAMPPRDVAATNPHGVTELTFYHPDMQETVYQLAEESPVDARRGVRVEDIEFGAVQRVRFQEAGHLQEATARQIVGADGYPSMVGRAAGFRTERDPDRLQTAGVLIETTHVSEERVHVFLGENGMSLWFPLGGNRVRAYIVH